MLKITDLKQLADGHGIVDIFGYCYHKEADGIRCHETDALYRWRNISPIMLDNLTIIQQTEIKKQGLQKALRYDIIFIVKGGHTYEYSRY